jgi:hypothetical protein
LPYVPVPIGEKRDEVVAQALRRDIAARPARGPAGFGLRVIHRLANLGVGLAGEVTDRLIELFEFRDQAVPLLLLGTLQLLKELFLPVQLLVLGALQLLKESLLLLQSSTELCPRCSGASTGSSGPVKRLHGPDRYKQRADERLTHDMISLRLRRPVSLGGGAASHVTAFSQFC